MEDKLVTILCELNREYIPLIEKRIQVQPTML